MTVSVAIALYNGSKFIEKQLDTIRTQTVPADQVVLCDDGSNDNTVQIVNDYINKHALGNNWKLYKNEKNLGYAKNFYKAMGLCECDLIYLCDQDDVWKTDKIEKMNKIMEENPLISLLMCKGGVVDANGEDLHGLLIKKSEETNEIRPIFIDELFRVFDWTGMLMCVRKSFFDSVKDGITSINAPHDFVLALCSTDKESFYVYDYVGAYHRRHDNNAANEEHRISRLLNLKRKLRDIDNYNGYLSAIAASNINVKSKTMEMLKQRLLKSQQRKDALKEKSLKKILKVYTSDKENILRPLSFVCDLWLVLFGREA